MATIMEKDSLIHLISYAGATISLKLEENSHDFQENMKIISNKRNVIYTQKPEEIDFNAEVASIQKIINAYKNLPNLPQYQ